MSQTRHRVDLDVSPERVVGTPHSKEIPKMNTRAFPARLAGVSVLLSILALVSGFASALENPAMVKDVRPGVASSNPEKFLPVGGKLFFVANDGTHGLEPWVSDGTLGGTSLLLDIWAGPNGGILLGCPTCNAVSAGSVVYFSAYNGANGSQLWRTDGTVAGTANVYPEASASTLTVVGCQHPVRGSSPRLLRGVPVQQRRDDGRDGASARQRPPLGNRDDSHQRDGVLPGRRQSGWGFGAVAKRW